MSDTASSSDALSSATRTRLEEIVERFEAAWEQGPRPRIEDYLPLEPGRLRRNVLAELVHVDLERRLKLGEDARVERYLRRFPELAENRSGILTLVASVYALRRWQAEFLPEVPGPAPGPPSHATVSWLTYELHDGEPCHAAGPVTASPLPSIPGHELLEVLGRGGMGIVYKARHEQLDRLVALKMILAGTHASPEHVARFLAEARAVARLQHPNIVQLHEIGEHEGKPFFALEFIDGGSLAKRLGGEPQPARASALLIATLAQAVHYAHQRGIIHRDLKPANILLTGDGTPKITDFGLAKLDGDPGQTRPDAVIGTPSYMAPEQAADHVTTIGPAADVYALGAILYEMLTGRPPFRGPSLLDTLDQVRRQEPVAPSRLVPGIPRDLETICLKCLRKEPQRRYADAEALADDLARFLRGEPVWARPVGVVERTWRWARRNRALSASLVSAFCGCLAVMLSLAQSVVVVSDSRDEAIKLATENQRLAWKLEKARDDAQAQAIQNEKLAKEESHLRNEMERAVVRQSFEQAHARARESAAWGLLAFADSLEQAQKAKTADLECSIRRQLAAWGRDVHPLRTMFALGTACSALAISPDGKTVLTGGGDGSVWLRVGDTSRALGTGPEATETIHAATFSPDGSRLLTARHDGTVQVWETATARLLGPGLPHPQARLTALVWAADGKSALTQTSAGSLQAWNVETGKPRGEAFQPSAASGAVALSGDGRVVLTGGGDGMVLAWSAETGRFLGTLMRASSGGRAAAFARGGARVLMAGDDSRVQVWDVSTGKAISPLLHQPFALTAVAFSADGTVIATAGGDGLVRLWQAATGHPVGGALHHPNAVTALALSTDGRSVVTKCYDEAVRVWDVASERMIGAPLTHPAAIRQALFSPDGQTLLTVCSDNQVRFWNAATGKPIGVPLRHNASIGAVCFSKDGDLALTGSADGVARLWQVPTGELLVTMERQPAALTAVTFAPDGKTIWTGSQEGTVQQWQTASGDAIGSPLLHEGPILALGFDERGTTLLSESGRNVLRRWHTGTGAALGAAVQQGPHKVLCVAFSPDGAHVLTGNSHGTLRVWDVATGKAIGAPLQQPNAVTAVAYAPVDSLAATAMLGSDAVWLWDLATGKPVGGPFRHRDAVNAVAINAARSVLVTGCQDGTARLWPLPQPLAGKSERVVLWCEVVTGMQLDEDRAIRFLSPETWAKRRQRLRELGGSLLR
jgi:WD40 repeat protein/tRNA A-37 threonylcarbamoyl transferase component Bud32